MNYLKHLSYRDAVAYLFDRLDDLHLQESISSAVFNKKKSIKALISALNQADIQISNIRKKRESVALYIPKEITAFPLCSHEVYSGEFADAVTADPQTTLHPGSIDFFLNTNPWVELQAMHSQEIAVYADHPGHSKKINTKLIRVDHDTFNHRPPPPGVKYLYYNAENRLLQLSSPFHKNVFLVFEATLVAAKINLRNIPPVTFADVDADEADNEEHETWKVMSLKTPELHHNLLLDVASRYLLASQSDPVTPQEIEARLSGTENNNGPTAFTARGQYPAFGILN